MTQFLAHKPLKFDLWQQVTHACDDHHVGMITAFMQRGLNYSYEVTWGTEKVLWHLEEELRALPLKPPIGFAENQHTHEIAPENDPDCDAGATHPAGAAMRENRAVTFSDVLPD